MKICRDHGIPRSQIDVALGVFVLVVAVGASDCYMFWCRLIVYIIVATFNDLVG